MHQNNVSTTAASNKPSPAPPKPIRFVTNHDGPYAKRRRINSACLTCRKKKTRCSGERPICGTCIQNKHECGGYGAENDKEAPFSPVAEDSKESVRKAIQKDGSHSANSPVRKSKPDPPPQLSRPSMSHTISTSSAHSHGSDTPAQRTGSLSDGLEHPALSLSTRNRMPYFRYFGPTAIMPGFKQMVVKVRGKQHGTGQTSSDPFESSPGQQPSVGPVSPSQVPEARTPVEIPVYDTSDMAPSPLITHLCKTFFLHLGCSFPFLQKDRFMRDLEEKQVDAILVDAVCALAARFSDDPMLTGSPEHPKDTEVADAPKLHPSEYGSAFAQRAKSAIPDAFPCPSVAVVQAALLLAYDEFGASRDSGLWMYLGVAIRMAQDLGMQTLEGLRYEGRDGPTPKSVKTSAKNGTQEPQMQPTPLSPRQMRAPNDAAVAEQKSVERERIDTFWSIFFLDRVISSGTGRPVTLRDRDIEISFPSLDEVDPASGWPLPFPALIRIVHLYGRVTDLLNSIKEKSHVTQDIIKRLAAMEFHLTEIYQGLSPKLHFNAVNFQHYAKVNNGTNFVLLHCWFHILIVLLHQPTLLKTFEGSIQQLLPNSRELSMSSAKTIADILAFAELIDSKSGLGNPFTSQPIYIAACAFLKETALHTASSNPQSSPSTPNSYAIQDDTDSETQAALENGRLDRVLSLNGEKTVDTKQAAKHTLLASAANQNYQRCYRALKSLESCWAGVKYILTVLDQKAKGVGDPLLYTREEMESALELPRPEPAFTSPGWRRKLSWGTYLSTQNIPDMANAKVPSALRQKAGNYSTSVPGSPMINASQAIGWSLTGTMNSPSTSLAVLYPNDSSRDTVTKTNSHSQVNKTRTPSMGSILHPPTSDPLNTNTRIKYENAQTMPSPSSFSAAQSFNAPAQSAMTSMPPPSSTNFHSGQSQNANQPDPVLVSDADLLLNLHSPFSASSPSNTRMVGNSPFPPPGHPHQQHLSPDQSNAHFSPWSADNFNGTNSNQLPFGDMMIESQDIDMSALGDDMMPWLEYLPHDMLSYYDPGPTSGGGFVGDGSAGGTGT